MRVPSALGLLMLALTACTNVPARSAVGRDATSTSFALAHGGELRLGCFRGDVVVLAFFTTYCPTSPGILRAIEDLRVNHAAGLTVIAVDEGGTEVKVKELADKLGVHVTLALDRSGVAADQMGLVTVPSVVVIDRQGAVRHVHAGYHGDDDRSAIDREVFALLLEARPPTPAAAESLGASSGDAPTMACE